MVNESTPHDSTPPGQAEATVLQRMIGDLSGLSDSTRRRLVETVCTYFGIAVPARRGEAEPEGSPPTASTVPTHKPFRFSEPETPTPKRFLMQKNPNTDVERVACLAYYLTHYRDTAHFKTKDITALNTEAAQRRFSNTAFSVENASKLGYLVPSVKGSKQLSAMGEQYVEAMPDRQAAKGVMENARPRRSRHSSKE